MNGYQFEEELNEFRRISDDCWRRGGCPFNSNTSYRYKRCWQKGYSVKQCESDNKEMFDELDNAVIQTYYKERDKGGLPCCPECGSENLRCFLNVKFDVDIKDAIKFSKSTIRKATTVMMGEGHNVMTAYCKVCGWNNS